MIYFLDTSALQYRYLDGVHSRGIRRIISDKRNQCYISELTVLEIASALASKCRKENISLKEFARKDNAFWRDVREKRLRVRPVAQDSLLRARALLRHAAEIKRKMTSADSVVASSALELAYEEGERVTLCLEDWPLYDVVRRITAYKATLRFKFLGVDKAAPRGAGKST